MKISGNGHGKCHCKFLDRISRLLGKWNWPKLFYFLESQNNFFSQNRDFHSFSFHFVSFCFANYSKPLKRTVLLAVGGHEVFFLKQQNSPLKKNKQLSSHILIVVSHPPRALRAYNVSHDIPSNLAGVCWQTYIWRRGGITRREAGPAGEKKSAKFTAKTSKPFGNRKFRREKKNRKQENAEENSHRDHVLDIKSCQIRWAKQEPTETCRIRQK